MIAAHAGHGELGGLSRVRRCKGCRHKAPILAAAARLPCPRAAISAMAAMVKEMQQRAGRQEQVGKVGQAMGRMLSEQVGSPAYRRQAYRRKQSGPWAKPVAGRGASVGV